MKFVALASDREPRPTVAVKNGDDAIFETYLQHANVTGYYKREAETVWALFKSLCDKPLKDATRDDGRKIVQHFEAQGLKSASIRKKIGWLNCRRQSGNQRGAADVQSLFIHRAQARR